MRMTRRVLVLTALAYRVAVPAELTPEQWRADLKTLATELPRLHKNLFFQLPKPEFERQVKQLDESIPKLTDLEIRAALMRLLASVGNAHTTINAFGGPYFPIQFTILPDGIYVTATPADHPEAGGARLVAINGTSAGEAQQKLLPYFAKENDVAILVQTPVLLRTAAALQSAGITQTLEQAEFTLERDGVQSKLPLSAAGRVAMTGVRGGPRRRNADYWFEYLPESHTMFVQYNACRESKDQPFREFTAAVMKAAAAQAVERYVVDLRFNQGGNSSVIQPLVQALGSQRKARVFALVGRYTFSSGFMAARDLKRNARGVLVGEAMGQRPNSYGDIRPLKLPNSGLTAYYCTKYFKLWDGDPPEIEPDVPVKVSATDYFSGRDPALEYALTH